MYHVYSNYSKINQFGIFLIWWFSPLYRRCTIEYQYSCQYSHEYLSTCPRVRVQVRVLSLCNSRVRVQYEYQKLSTRVRVPSTSTPALVGAVPTGDAPTTSEWPTFLLPTKVRLILEIWQYVAWNHYITIIFHQNTHERHSINVSGNGLVPWGNKPSIPEPISTKIYVATWHN